jgi:UDP-N-acetyl-D-mannosaminuronic acid dehydrogenase
MDENGISDVSRVGLYGLTYKEDVDDVRESPALQLLESMRRHLGGKIRAYDPFVSKSLCDGQVFDFDEFLNSVDIVVVLTAHTHIKENADKLRGKIIFDTKNVIPGDGVYKL